MRIFRFSQSVDEINRDSVYCEFRERHTFVYMIVLTIIAIGMVLGFHTLDYILNLTDIRNLLLTRIFTACALATNMLVAFTLHRTRLRSKIHIYIGFYLLTAYSSFLTHFSGGFASSYWAGFNFVLVFWLGIIPFSYIEVIFSGVVLLTIYNALLIALEYPYMQIGRFLEYNFFLAGSLLIGSTITFFNNRNSGKIYQTNLELHSEKDKTESLLLNILPRVIADRLKKGEGMIADHFEIVTVLFADIVGFTKLSQTMSSKELVDKLNEVFSSFDKIAVKLKIEKIKTIGDCYMAVAGIPEKQENHAEIIIKMGIEMLNTLALFNKKYSMNLSIRIGVNSGEVVAGVIGEHKFIYDLWGDAVNTASRMESHGIPGKIHVTRETYEILKNKFEFDSRGYISVKGKGKMETFTVRTVF